MTILAIAAFALNLPFGYLRAASNKFSIKWFLYIHLPIPFIIAIRWAMGVDYRVIPLVVIGAVAGQYLGGRLNKNGKP
ncbi:MAG: hypothetical protein HZC45_07655 [Deltaproteobacteria bacterium]|nr:hypothetical protein [Deltaproteobacteria bacterium]